MTIGLGRRAQVAMCLATLGGVAWAATLLDVRPFLSDGLFGGEQLQSAQASYSQSCYLGGVGLLGQCQLPWGPMDFAYHNPPQTKPGTFCRYGCNVTSAAMLVNYYAGTLVTNPILLNTWLMDNDSGYRNSGDFSDVSIARYAREEHGLSLHYCGRTISLDSVRETICRQDAAILKVPDHPQHFVLATAISGLGPNTTITVADPGRGSGFLRDVTSYLNARLYSSAACYQSGIRLLGKSPIALLVEDPLGRRAGVDPSTGQQIQEIPGGFFELWSLGADDDSGEAEPPVLEFEVLTTLDGIYTVAVSGTDIGAYHLTFLGYDANGEETAFTVFGVTAPQHTDEYQFAFAPGLQSSITEPRHAASLLGLTFEVSVCRTLGLIDNDGLARSLAQKLRAVSAALQRGSPSAARNALRAFIQEVSAQSGKHLTTEAAGLLRGDAESLLK